MRSSSTKRQQTPSMYSENPGSKQVKSTIENLNDRPPLFSGSHDEFIGQKKSIVKDPDFKPAIGPSDDESSASLASSSSDEEKNKSTPNSSSATASTSKKEVSKKSKKKSKQIKTAGCHEYFETVDVNGVTYDKCKILVNGAKCSAKFKHHGSTTRMNEHLREAHALTQFKSKINPKKEVTDLVKLLVHFVISTASPFSIVEDEYFKALIKKSISFEIPNRKVLKEMVNKVYEEKCQEIINELKEIEYVALTTDGWTAKHQKLSYNSSTLHHLNDLFQSKTIHLGIHQVKGHDSSLTAAMLQNKLNNFKVFDKISFMAVDNASVMKKTCEKLKKEFVGCLNHLLNLIVRGFFNSKIIQGESDNDLSDDEEDQADALDDIFDEEVDELEELNDDEDELNYSDKHSDALKTVGSILKKIKKIVYLFNMSTHLRQQLISRCGLTLINDIKIRWNYTLLMIERYLSQYDDVIHIITNSPAHNKKYTKYFLSDNEKDILGCVKQILKPFYAVTQILGKFYLF